MNIDYSGLDVAGWTALRFNDLSRRRRRRGSAVSSWDRRPRKTTPTMGVVFQPLARVRAAGATSPTLPKTVREGRWPGGPIPGIPAAPGAGLSPIRRLLGRVGPSATSPDDSPRSGSVAHLAPMERPS